MSAGLTGLLDRINFRDEGDPPEADVAASLSEMDQDPEPGRKATTTRKRRTTRRAGSSSTSSARSRTPAQVKKDLVDELTMYAKMFALGWSVRCPVCGGTLDEQSAAIADSTAALIARSDWLLAKVATTTMLADVVKLLHALWPVARAMQQHGAHSAHDHQEGGGGGPDWNAYDQYPAYQRPA